MNAVRTEIDVQEDSLAVETAIAYLTGNTARIAEALGRMAAGLQALVRAEDAATVDAWLAERGATVQAVGA